MRKDFGIYKRTRDKKGYYYYSFYDEDGVRRYRSTGETVKSKAWNVVIEKYKNGTLYDHPYQRTSFGVFAKPFWIYETCPIVQNKTLRGGSITRGYCAQSRATLENHILPVFGKMAICEINSAKLEKWLFDLSLKKHLNNKTANKARLVFKQMLDVAVKQRLISSNPFNQVPPLIEKDKRRNAFTPEEVKNILSYKWDNKMAFAACMLAATTGMRMGEIRALTVEQIHDDYIDVCQAWAEHDGVKTPKSGKSRIVPIDPIVRDLLLDVAPDKQGFVFTYNLNKPVDFKFITDRLKKIMEELGIDWRKDNLTFHSFRHYFNTRLVAAGVAGETVRAVIGHESAEMTDRYLHLQSKDLDFIRHLSDEITTLCS